MSPSAERQVTLFAAGTLALHVTAPTPPSARWADALRIAPVDVAVGGGTAITCMHLSRLGHRVEMMPLIGGDRLGDYLVQELVEHGVECHRTVVDGTRTSRTVALTAASGLHDITFQPGDPDPRALLPFLDEAPAASFVYAPGFPGFEPVLEHFKRSDAVVVADLGYRPWLTDADGYCSQILERCGSVDVVVFSGQALDAHQLSSILRAAGGAGPKLVVATLGAGGARYVSNEGAADSELVPAVACEAKNTHGAGDAFVAGLIAGLAEGGSPREAVRLGHATAAAAISLFPSLVDRRAVDDLLRSER
jgi:sugar/nucleoside kinase (ribokinase family)